MIDLKADAWAETPKPREWWRDLSDEERSAAVNPMCVSTPWHNVIIGFTSIRVKEARADGQIIVEVLPPLSAAERGTVVLDYESALKGYVDPALTVWLEPMGDRNSLRNLRGVEMK